MIAMNNLIQVCGKCIRDAGLNIDLSESQSESQCQCQCQCQSYCEICELKNTFPVTLIEKDQVDIIVATQRLDRILVNGDWREIKGEKCFTQKLLGVWHYWSSETGWHNLFEENLDEMDKNVDTNQELCHTQEN